MDQVHPGCPNKGWGEGCGWPPSARALSEVSSTILFIPLFALSPVIVPMSVIKAIAGYPVRFVLHNAAARMAIV